MAAGPQSLAGQTVLLLRAAGQEADLKATLGGLGARVLHIPVLEIQPPASFDRLDAALRQLDQYHWLLFTSSNGVSHFAARAGELGVSLNAATLGAIRVCAIGPATQAEAKAKGLPVHLVPKAYVAEGLVAAFAEEDLQGKRILLPRAAFGRDVAPEALRERGAVVDVVEAYRTGMPPDAEKQISDLIASGQAVDWVLFSSGSTVKNLLAAGGRALLSQARLLSIGPATSEVMRKHGLAPSVECEEHSSDGVVQALLDAVSAPGPHASMEDSAKSAH